MLYFPIVEGTFPNWVPGWGGEHFLFFRPVFNIADASITTGVLMILLFQRRLFARKNNEFEEEKSTPQIIND
jgi:signal peptidase II